MCCREEERESCVREGRSGNLISYEKLTCAKPLKKFIQFSSSQRRKNGSFAAHREREKLIFVGFMNEIAPWNMISNFPCRHRARVAQQQAAGDDAWRIIKNTLPPWHRLALVPLNVFYESLDSIQYTHSTKQSSLFRRRHTHISPSIIWNFDISFVALWYLIAKTNCH